jgi:F-type H+-transporting ATPase subunit gamma
MVAARRIIALPVETDQRRALTEAAIEALVSENAARFAAMDSAHDNVSKTLERLRQDARQARQDDITTELLDLVTGAEALNSAEPRSRA